MIIMDNFCYFCIKTFAVTPHLNRLDSTRDLETLRMRGHNIWFQRELRKIIPQLSPITPSYEELWSQCMLLCRIIPFTLAVAPYPDYSLKQF